MTRWLMLVVVLVFGAPVAFIAVSYFGVWWRYAVGLFLSGGGGGADGRESEPKSRSSRRDAKGVGKEKRTKEKVSFFFLACLSACLSAFLLFLRLKIWCGRLPIELRLSVVRGRRTGRKMKMKMKMKHQWVLAAAAAAVARTGRVWAISHLFLTSTIERWSRCASTNSIRNISLQWVGHPFT